MDFKELAEELGLEEEEYQELVELFIETSRPDLDQLQAAIDEGNAENAGNIAHSLKGAAASLGLEELAQIAKEIEQKARNNTLEGTAESAQALKKKLDAVDELAGG